MTTRILIADDHGVIRAGMRAFLEQEPGFQVVGEAADGSTTQKLALELNPDILLLDITMPGLDGIQVTRSLHQALPQLRILILTLHEGVSILREAIAAGAHGYIVKRAGDVELIGAIKTVMRGEMYVHPTMAQALLKEFAPRPPAGHLDTVTLTPREIEILQLIARGQSNRQIAQTLSLSIRTVDTHRANLMSKLNAESRADLVRYALEHHLID